MTALVTVVTSAALAFPVLANDVETSTTVNSDVTVDNKPQASLVTRSRTKVFISIVGKIGITNEVFPFQGLAQSFVDNKQFLSGNAVIFLTPEDDHLGIPTANNNASLGEGGGAFKNLTGNIAVNINAGDNNAQDNSMAIGLLQTGQQALKIDVLRLQESVGNSLRVEGPNTNFHLFNTAVVADGTFNNASGNVNANVSAGDNNGQANGVALSLGTRAGLNILATTNTGAIQNSSENETDSPHATNQASVGAVGINVTGNIHLNVAAGAHNLQNNSLAITALGPVIQ